MLKFIEAEWHVYEPVNDAIITSDNGLSPARRQPIIWTNDDTLSIRPFGTHFNEILFEIQEFSFTKIHLNISSARCRPFCLGLNVLGPSCEVPVFFSHLYKNRINYIVDQGSQALLSTILPHIYTISWHVGQSSPPTWHKLRNCRCQIVKRRVAEWGIYAWVS